MFHERIKMCFFLNRCQHCGTTASIRTKRARRSALIDMERSLANPSPRERDAEPKRTSATGYSAARAVGKTGSY